MLPEGDAVELGVADGVELGVALGADGEADIDADPDGLALTDARGPVPFFQNASHSSSVALYIAPRRSRYELFDIVSPSINRNLEPSVGIPDPLIIQRTVIPQ